MPQDTPAIVRDYASVDGEAPVVQESYNAVSFIRGLGDSGYKVQLVEYDCPECGFDRMVRRVDIKPELPDTVRYWCLNPSCPYHVGTTMSHAFQSPPKGAPRIFEEPADV